MPAARIRIVIDTNWWISTAIAKMHNQIMDEVILNESFELCASIELDIEVMDMINKPRLRRFIQLKQYFEFLHYYSSSTVLIPVTSKVAVCRDPKDNFLLALAKDAGADFLITGDKDLLCLERFEQTQIVSLSQFFELSFA